MNAAAPDHHDARPSAHTSGHSTPPRFRAVAISGSLRRGSSNTALIRVAQRVAHEQLPADLHVEIVDWIDQLPWMNPDLEDDLPEAVIRWRELVREADALIIGLPEYNYGPSPLAKNAIDWITRPPHDRVITGKVIAFMTGQTRPMWDFEDIGDWYTRANPDGIAKVIEIEAPAAVLRYVVEKGSIAVDGVSLSLARGHRHFVALEFAERFGDFLARLRCPPLDLRQRGRQPALLHHDLLSETTVGTVGGIRLPRDLLLVRQVVGQAFGLGLQLVDQAL